MKLNVREISFGFPDFKEDGMCVEREIKKSIKRQLDKYTRKPKTDCKVALINFGYVRHIFKTESLIEYAKDNDCVVIRSLSVLEVFDMNTNKWVKVTEDVEKYFANTEKILVDEWCNYDKLPSSVQDKIIGGYYTNQDEYKKGNDAIDIMKILEKESQELSLKIQKVRETDNYGTYKNLVMSLRDVLKLRQDMRNNTL